MIFHNTVLYVELNHWALPPETAMSYQEPELVITVKDNVRILRLNRPKRKNAINANLYLGIIKALEAAAADLNTVLVVVTGTADYFTSGNDLGAISQTLGGGPSTVVSEESANISGEHTMKAAIGSSTDRFNKFVSAFIDFPKPLIAVVNGPAVGIGVTILGLFDVVYATDRATFHTPFVELGQAPEGCSTYIFPRIMGPGKAAEMILFGKKINAAEACKLGLVTEVFPDACLDQVWPRIYQWAKLPPNTLINAKGMLRSIKKDLLHKVNDMECKNLEERVQSDEFFTAMMTFFSKKSKL